MCEKQCDPNKDGKYQFRYFAVLYREHSPIYKNLFDHCVVCSDDQSNLFISKNTLNKYY